jgi:hypothetical protein
MLQICGCGYKSDILGCSVADLRDFDADPYPSFQIKAQNLVKAKVGACSIHFWLVICK